MGGGAWRGKRLTPMNTPYYVVPLASISDMTTGGLTALGFAVAGALALMVWMTR